MSYVTLVVFMNSENSNFLCSLFLYMITPIFYKNSILFSDLDLWLKGQRYVNTLSEVPLQSRVSFKRRDSKGCTWTLRTLFQYRFVDFFPVSVVSPFVRNYGELFEVSYVKLLSVYDFQPLINRGLNWRR